MKKVNIYWILGAIMLSSCAAPFKVIHFSNELPADKTYQTFQLENLKLERDKEELMQKPELIKELEGEIVQQMVQRNYRQSLAKPDLVLRYEIIANQISEVNATPYNTMYRPGFYNPYGGFYRGITRREFTESILLLELRDFATDKIIWQGSLDMRYSRRTKNIPNIVADGVYKVFQTYPYQAPLEVPE